MKKLKSMLRLKRIILTLLIIAGLFVGYSTIKAKLTPLKVETAKARAQDLEETVAISGFIKADKQADLGYSATTSKLTNLAVKVGDNVSSGATLASTDTATLLAEVNAAEAAYNQARNTYLAIKNNETITNETYNNERYLGSDRIQALKDQAFLNSRAADDAVTRAEATLEEAKLNLAKSVLTSPIAGTVTQVNGLVGEIPAGTLIQVTDLSSLYFNTLIDELDIQKIKLGQTVEINLDAAKNTPLTGIITSIAPTTTKDSGNNTTIEVKIDISDGQGITLRPGMEGDADIITNKHPNILTVPFEAVVDEAGNKYVWVVTNGLVHKTPVTTGTEGEFDTEIKTGIAEGDVVISNPAKTLREGQKVSGK